MNKNSTHLTLSLLALAAAWGFASPVWAQVAGGTTTANVSVIETTQLALGWSVKKTLLGKTIYNDAGEKVGKVEDLIISPDKNLSYVIVGAGGFIGIGRHDVAIPVNQIQDKDGMLVMAGASKGMIKAMPEFTYATDTAKRDQFVVNAEAELARGRAKLAELNKSAGLVASDAKVKIDLQIAALQTDLKSTELKLNELKQATALRWRELETSVSEAAARLRKSIDAAVG